MEQSVLVARLDQELWKLLGSIDRNRRTEEEIVLEHTEDEGDLAYANHAKELAKKLGDAKYRRLLEINEASIRAHKDEHNECKECGRPIGDKRLEAVPWAILCINCQSEAEVEETMQGQRAFGAHAMFEEA